MRSLEWSGEVVVLRSLAADGAVEETRLWVADYDGFAWLRTGNPESQWLARIEGDPCPRHPAV